MATLRKSLGFAMALASLVFASSSHAATWAPMASISATAALVTNSLCYTDGTDMVCNGAGPALTAGGSSSPTVTTGLSGSIIYRDGNGNLIANGLFSISSTTGSVGIGAGAPDTLGNNGLYTSGNIQTNGTLFTGSIEKLTNGYGLIWQDGGSGIVANGSGASSYMFFKTNGAEALRIVSTGYVGIGTSTPNAKLDVYGVVSATGLNLNASTFNNTAAQLRVGPSAGYSQSILEFQANRGGGTALAHTLQFWNLTNNIAGLNVNTGTGTNSGVMAFFTANAGTLTEKMRIDQTGYVGIGTANPSTTLHVVGTTSELPPLRINSTGAQQLELRGTGTGSNSNGLVISDPTGDVQSGLRSNGRNIELSVRSSGSLFPKVYANENAVGILTTAPSTSLHVLGAIRLGEEISGTYSWGSDTCDTNRAGSIKYSAGTFSTCNGTAWSALGGAGASTFASLTDVSVSITGGNIFGPGSLTGATTGVTAYTAFGIGALHATNSGVANSAFGNNALYSNSTGTWNTANGASALYFNTTGSGNTATGINAIGTNATGSYNTANGYYALSTNTADYNTADGANALKKNTTGTQNTANGTYALYSTTTGNNNAATGSNAGYAVTSGNNNSFFGTYAGQAVTTASSNTLVGYNAGGGITTGANNLVIGALTTPYSNTGSNQLNIANAIWGNIGSGSGNANKIGINVPSPTTSLEVAGTISATALTVNGVAITSGGGATDRITSGTVSVIAQTAGTVQISATSTRIRGTLDLLTNAGDNVYVGYNATTGSGTYNVAVGEGALQYNSGSNQVAMGYTAAGSATGSNITAVGYQAAQYADGTDIVALGDSASRYSSGSYSVAVGTSAGYSNTAIGNIGVGYYAASTNSSGVGNTAVGYLGLTNNATGTYNTALGYSAGQSSSGKNISYNTLIGAYAGNALTTGNGNVLFGYNTGAGITTGSSNTLIGSNLSPFSNTGSNQLNIANAIWGNIGSGMANANKIGINVTSPTTALEVAGTISATALTVNGVAITSGGGATDRITSSTTAAVIANTSGGTVSFTLGGTAGAAYLHPTLGLVAAGVSTTGAISATTAYFTPGNGYYQRIYQLGASSALELKTPNSYAAQVFVNEGSQLSFYNGNTTRMIINSDGTVGIGTLSPSSTLHVAGTGVFNGAVGIGTTNPGAYMLYVAGNAYSTGTFSTSDARYKENIQPMSGLLAKVDQLRPVTFTWKKNAFPAKDNPGEQIGLIAQEVEKVYPELVHTNSDGYKAVAYDKLGVLLLGAVKDLKTQNEALVAENAALKAQQADILKRLSTLEAHTK